MKRRQTSCAFPRANSDYRELEQRQMLAGNVGVFEVNSILYLRADRSDNQVQISVNAAGDVVVSGTDGTQINGGNNPFVMSGANGQISGLRARMGAGNDSLFVEDVSINGRSVVYGDSGDDSIGFYQVDVADSFFAETASGNDFVSIDEVDIGGNLIVNTLAGNDTVGIDRVTVDGFTLLMLGHGNDRLSISNSVHNNSAYVYSHLGNDFIGTDGVTIRGRAVLGTGLGSDDVYLNDTSIVGPSFVRGGAGSDRLEVDGASIFSVAPRVQSFEGNDVAGGRLQAADVYNDLILDGARLGTITELAVLTPNLSTLVGALQATGLTGALSGPGPFTVFAPLNSAFAKISGVVSGLTVNQLSDVLKFHVVSGAVSSQQLVTQTSVNTLLGQSFSVAVNNGNVTLNGNATLGVTDIRAKNGIIHLLNDVLVPQL